MSTSRLTTAAYWEQTYAAGGLARLQTGGFRNHCSRRIVEKLEEWIGADSRVLEIGAGNSAVLTFLANRHAGRAQFTGLDYSENGCAMLEARSRAEGVTVDVIKADMFDPANAAIGRFDLVYSLGVVEHFADLAVVLAAMKRFLSPTGRLLTIIPNMAGVLGALTRRYNKKVYDIHVPHTLNSFLKGHSEAGLDVLSSGYICSSNFGVLSSCFASDSDPGYRTYTWLTRVSKALWFVEHTFGDLPHTATFSPYLFAVSGVRSEL